MTAKHATLALLLAAALVACSDRTPAANGGDGGSPADGPYLLDDAGRPILDDAGNPIPAPQDAGQADSPVAPQSDGGAAQQDSGATPGVIQCGNTTTCDAASQKCCVTQGGASCIDQAAQCQGLAATCDGPEDCIDSAPICCATLAAGSRGVTCTTDAACQGQRLCRVDNDCAGGDKCCGSVRVGGLDASYCMAEAQCPSTNPTAGVPCGNSTCNSPQVCCASWQGQSCTDSGACQGMSLACDGPEDCSGGTPVCCGQLSMGGGGTECVATGDCAGGYQGGVVCHDDGDCPTGTCTSIPMVPVRVCR